ncbi:MAG TPA: hypothetical protein DEV73_04480 [Candidatus Zambryskibacteria bacterium]|nr:hypothetical protein [Candidatus Zambryskibacteria bacterium]
MTFIANVIARDGVALVADSLVTTQSPVLSLQTFRDYLQNKNKLAKGQKITLDPVEVGQLFKNKPIYTRNYENKLFEIDHFTGVMTAGAAEIFDKKIAQIVEEIAEKNKELKSYTSMKTEDKVRRFCRLISREVKDHIKKYGRISTTKFIYTHYDGKKKTSEVYEIEVKTADNTVLTKKKYSFVTCRKTMDIQKVVFAGQNKIAESILFGNFFTSRDTVVKLIDKLTKDKKITSISKKYTTNILMDPSVVESGLNMNMANLHDLSLQEAVNLASLLMRVELDFQKYTKDIPTVGGVIKLAVIDKDGFRYIHGHEIVKPSNIE